MWYEHVKGGHLGVAASIAKVRSIYWILGINKTMKAMISNCVKCKRMRLNMCSQIMSPLPIERIQPNPQFTNIGVDYFGPFEIKGEIQRTDGVLWWDCKCHAWNKYSGGRFPPY